MKVFVLQDAAVRRRAAAFVIDDAPEGSLVTVGPPKKTRDQEKLAHSCYSDFSQFATVNGNRISADEWKTKLKLDFFDETGADPEYIEDWKGLEPKLTPVPGTRYVIASEIASSRFPRKLYRAFITYLHSEGDAQGVQWSPASLGRENATA